MSHAIALILLTTVLVAWVGVQQAYRRHSHSTIDDSDPLARCGGCGGCTHPEHSKEVCS